MRNIIHCTRLTTTTIYREKLRSNELDYTFFNVNVNEERPQISERRDCIVELYARRCTREKTTKRRKKNGREDSKRGLGCAYVISDSTFEGAGRISNCPCRFCRGGERQWVGTWLREGANLPKGWMEDKLRLKWSKARQR